MTICPHQSWVLSLYVMCLVKYVCKELTPGILATCRYVFVGMFGALPITYSFGHTPPIENIKSQPH
jgi:hypothetical protein